MAIRAQQPNVSGVCTPVGEATTPRVSSLMAFLFSPVYVVNIERPEIVKPTQDALPAKGLNQSKFSLPVPWGLVDYRTVFVPVLSSAFWCAKTVRAILAAIGARLVCTPPCCKVAGLAAILSGPVFEPVGVHHRVFSAMRARYVNWLGSLFSHVVTVPYDSARTKNLDNGPDLQPRLFKDEPPKPKQEALL